MESSLSFSNITVILNKQSSNNKVTKQTILNNVCGEIHNGELIGIVGASGCGKTTLLSILSGRIHTISNLSHNYEISGKILWDQQKLNAKNKSHLFTLSNHSAFVMQENIFHPTIKVREAIEFSAYLRNEKQSKVNINKEIDNIINDLELQKCQQTIIGNGEQYHGISGGERKRTSIGVELVCNPKFVILDEPTTGLDSVNALNVMTKLKDLTKKQNKMIIASIHQPSSSIIELLDK
eukprot:433621_1